MKAAFLVGLFSMVLIGCGANEDEKIESACQELLELTVVNPMKMQINKKSLKSAEMEKDDALEVLERLYGKPVSVDQLAALDISYQPDGKRPKSYFVSIDYTDEGGVIPRRGEAFCRFYSDGGRAQLVSAVLAGDIRLSGGADVFSFFNMKGRAKGMDHFGVVGK